MTNKDKQKQNIIDIMQEDEKLGLYEEPKQTAVEWLQSALEHTILTHEQVMQTIGLFEQTKEMEKKQIIDAFGVGCQVESTRLIGYHSMAEQYYNETYK